MKDEFYKRAIVYRITPDLQLETLQYVTTNKGKIKFENQHGVYLTFHIDYVKEQLKLSKRLVLEELLDKVNARKVDFTNQLADINNRFQSIEL